MVSLQGPQVYPTWNKALSVLFSQQGLSCAALCKHSASRGLRCVPTMMTDGASIRVSPAQERRITWLISQVGRRAVLVPFACELRKRC